MNEQQAAPKTNYRRFLLPATMLAIVVALTALLYIHRDLVAELGNWGYLGAFVIGLVSNATILLPMPGLLLLFSLGAVFNPLLVGLAGAVGGTLGEMSGYLAGYSGQEFMGYRKALAKAENWTRKYGTAAIFVFSLIPLLPLDVAGIGAGILRFKVWKFLLATLAGKLILYTSLTYAATWGWGIINCWPG